jgi:hypothetical protein
MVRKGYFPRHFFGQEFLGGFMRIILGVSVASAIFASTPAAAQMPINNPVLDTIEFGRQIKSITDQGQPKQDNNPVSEPVYNTASTFNYQVSLQRRQGNYREFIEKSRMSDAAKATQAAALLKQGDIIETARGYLNQKYGLKIDNIADAYTMWKIAAWVSANQSDITITRTLVASVQRQVYAEFSGAASLVDAPDDFKQFFAENLWLNAFLINENNRLAGNDPAARNRLAQAVMRSSKMEKGIDLSTITLTDAGFVPRKSGKPR